MILTAAESHILMLLFEHGALSRQELHEKTGWRPNTVGQIAAQLIRLGMIREGNPLSGGPGRPRIPLLIDPQRRSVIGLAIFPRRVEACRMNLLGQRTSGLLTMNTTGAKSVISKACSLLEQVLDRDAMLVGISATGLLDVDQHEILFSSALTGPRALSIQPIFDMAGPRPVVFDNDMHAMAARWVLTHNVAPTEDLLIVHLRDGAVGAAIVINGMPNKGSVVGGNELGYSYLPVRGRMMRLEEIFSTAFLKEISGAGDTDLARQLEACADDNKPLQEIIDLLALGISNVINLIRPNRLVVSSFFVQFPRFNEKLAAAVQRHTIAPLLERLKIDWWDDLLGDHAENAGWLALANLYQRGHRPAPSRLREGMQAGPGIDMDERAEIELDISAD